MQIQRFFFSPPPPRQLHKLLSVNPPPLPVCHSPGSWMCCLSPQQSPANVAAEDLACVRKSNFPFQEAPGCKRPQGAIYVPLSLWTPIPSRPAPHLAGSPLRAGTLGLIPLLLSWNPPPPQPQTHHGPIARRRWAAHHVTVTIFTCLQFICLSLLTNVFVAGVFQRGVAWLPNCVLCLNETHPFLQQALNDRVKVILFV